LWFDVVNSTSLSQEQKDLILRRIGSRIGSRIGKDGVLRIISRQTRSQAENRELAFKRFIELLRDSVKQVPIGKNTRLSKGAKRLRLEEKKRHSKPKRKRSEKVPIEE
jgi:ribosome-associated protein